MANYDTLRLEKGLYTTGNFSAALERLDPSAQYQDSALNGLDAYQRQLKRFDIKVSGLNSDAVEKFFQSADSSVLFPEYVSRAVRQGMEEANVLPRLVASVTTVNGMDYRSITAAPAGDDGEPKVVAEGALIPETMVRTKENLVQLRKRGRMLVASYESIRFQRLDLFTVTLRQIGAYIARAQLKDAVEVLLNGDGNNNAAPVWNCAASGTVTYSDLVTFWNRFDPYELNTIVADPGVMLKLLNLPEFKDAAAGLNFQGSGKMITPIGADLIKSSAVGGNKLIGLDRRCALEMVKAGDVLTEYDKLIDRQLERAAISSIVGFAKIFEGAAQVLTV